MICPDCNKDHIEFEIKQHPTIKVMAYKCPFHDDKDHIITRVDEMKQFSDVKRKLRLIITPMFDDKKQIWSGESWYWSICCRGMNHQRQWNHALEYSKINHSILYDPEFFGGEDEKGHGIDYKGQPITECPFCGAEVEITQLVRE